MEQMRRIEEIPSVDIDPRDINMHGDFKYVVMEVTLGDVKKKVVASNMDEQFHNGIANMFACKHILAAIELRVLGDGVMRFSAQQKRITLVGTNEPFLQMEDRGQTARLLKEAYPDYEIIIAS